MPSLEQTFDELAARLKGPTPLSASATDPLFYLVYSSDQTMEVRRLIPGWSGRLLNEGLKVEVVSFSELVWDVIEASGRWKGWLQVEGDFDQGQVNEAVRSVVRADNALVGRVAERVGTHRPGVVVFFTDTEALHPYFRVRVIETILHDRIKVPMVVFYPGRRVGQFGLRFLDLYTEDSNYRSTIFGGVP